MQNSDEEFVQARNRLYQTEPMRLQAEANYYTQQLEHERKKLLIATDNEKQMREQLAEIKQKIEDKITEMQKQVGTEPEDEEQDAPPTEMSITNKNHPDYWQRLYPNPKKVKTEDQEKAYLKSL